MVAFTAVAIGVSLPAQSPGSPTRPAAIAGVISDTTMRPLAGAELLVDGTDLKAVSDDSGRFHLAGVPEGRNGFVVRKIGYTAVSFETTLAPDKTLVIQIRMQHAQALDAVVVSGERLLPGLARVGFYERERQGIGKYLRPESIDSLAHVTRPSMLLQNVTGLMLDCRRGARCAVRSSTPPYCLQLFVDGQYTTGSAVEYALDETLNPGTIGAIEIYRHPSSVPLQFQPPMLQKAGRGVTGQAGCGVIVVWTRGKTMR